MGRLGVHFAITEDEKQKLLSLQGDETRLEYVQEVLEETYFEENPQFCAETDKAWDAIHRALTDGSLSQESCQLPLGRVVLGGEELYSKDQYCILLKTAEEVQSVAGALASMTKEQLRQGYELLSADYGGSKADEDFQYTWEWFVALQQFWALAAESGRAVLFTVDQ